jgi:hypothetical protein
LILTNSITQAVAEGGALFFVQDTVTSRVTRYEYGIEIVEPAGHWKGDIFRRPTSWLPSGRSVGFVNSQYLALTSVADMLEVVGQPLSGKGKASKSKQCTGVLTGFNATPTAPPLGATVSGRFSQYMHGILIDLLAR